MKKLKFWLHEKIHQLTVYCFGAKTLFRYQCGCGASVLAEMPEVLVGAAFHGGGNFDTTPANGTAVRVECGFCDRVYELVWNQKKRQFTMGGDFSDYQPDTEVFTVRGADGGVIATGVSAQVARKYQEAWEGSTIEQG